MTSAAMRSRGSQAAEGRGYGLLIFASVLLLVVGFWNVIQGISAIARSRVFIGGAHYVFGDLRAWGWIALIFGVLQLVAGVGVLIGNQLARWFGIAVLGLNAIDQMFFIPAYPFWSLTIIAMDVVALYGLCAYGSRANVEAAT
jgi:hypothetical protein